MKVILLRDVARIGRRHEIKDVPDGYALNMLIPRKLALIATPDNLKKAIAYEASTAKHVALNERNFDEAILSLDNEPLVLHVEANKQGHLFKGVHANDIIQAGTERGIVLLPNQIDFKNPIKSTGDHSIELVSGTVRKHCTIRVVART